LHRVLHFTHISGRPWEKEGRGSGSKDSRRDSAVLSASPAPLFHLIFICRIRRHFPCYGFARRSILPQFPESFRPDTTVTSAALEHFIINYHDRPTSIPLSAFTALRKLSYDFFEDKSTENNKNTYDFDKARPRSDDGKTRHVDCST